MNAKAIIESIMDFPTDQRLFYTVRVGFIGTSGQGYLGTHVIDAEFLVTDSIAQIKTKIRQAVSVKANELGYNVAANDISSIFQI